MSKTSGPSSPINTPSSNVPRAVIHKKILDAAQSQPTASMKEIAADVSGASVDLVEKVFEEYGDPAETETPTKTETPMENGTQSADGNVEQPAANDESVPESDQEPVTVHPEPTADFDPDHLTEKQQATLRAIYENPEATQAELGELLRVSDATICQRVKSIDGFAWETRDEFVKAMENNGEMQLEEPEEMNAETPDLTDQVEELSQQIDGLEQRFETHDQPSTLGLADPELAHKIAHACLQADNITEEEELEILKVLMGHHTSE